MMNEKLIKVTVNQAGFEYDIHSLVKAFYPAGDVKVIVGEEEGPDAEETLQIHFTEEAVSIPLCAGAMERLLLVAGRPDYLKGWNVLR